MTISPPAVLLGSQQPRHHSAPPAASSWGPEVVDLAATVGLHLDEGQAAVITDGMGEAADGRWAASEVADVEPRQNGKGAILEARTLGGLFLLKERLIVWTAHEFKTAREGFLRVRSYVDNYDHLRKRVKAVRVAAGEEGIELLDGGRLRFLARSGGSGRGFSGDVVFLDEAYALTDDQMAALLPTLSARPNPQVWYMSSAPLPDSTVLRRVCLRGRRGAPGLVYFEWCAHKDARSDDPVAWAQANRALGERISPESVQRELGAIGDEQFRRERLGIWSELETGAAIDPASWEQLGDPQSRRDGDVALAVDIAPERDWAAVAVYGRRTDGLGHLQLVRYEAGTDWVVPALVELRGLLNPIAVGMGRGTYASLREALKEAGFLRPEDRPIQAVRLEGQATHPPQRGDLAVLNGTDMAAACGQLVDAVRQGTVRHVPAQQITAAVGAAKTRVTGDSIAWARSDRAVDITGLVAFTEARWAFEARVNAVEDYDPAGDLF